MASSRRLAILALAGVAALALIRTAGSLDTYVRWFPPPASQTPAAHYWRLTGMAWWAGIRVAAYLSVPLLVIRYSGALCFADLPLRRPTRSQWAACGAMFLALFPALWWAADRPDFRGTYPLYRLAHRSPFDFAAWEALYLAQFAALEIFFRGFLAGGLARITANPAVAVFLAAIPYTLIHLGKPPVETAGSFFAGVLLGMMAVRTGSLWGGAALHGAAAFTMDCLTTFVTATETLRS